MNNFTRRAWYWAPRALCIAFILFVSMFALDVFVEGRGFWRTLAALAIHLVPTYVLTAALLIAWRREWIGALLYAAAGVFFLIIARGWPAKAVFCGTCLLVAGLFLTNWFKRAEIRPKTQARLP